MGKKNGKSDGEGESQLTGKEKVMGRGKVGLRKFAHLVACSAGLLSQDAMRLHHTSGINGRPLLLPNSAIQSMSVRGLSIRTGIRRRRQSLTGIQVEATKAMLLSQECPRG